MNQFLDQWSNIPIAIKTLVVAFFWGMVIAGYYFMYYQDQYAMYRGLLNQFKAKRAERTRFETTAQNLPLWQEEIARLKEEQAKARTLLPTAKEIPQLLKQIDYLAGKSGLQIEQFTPIRERPKPYYAEVPMQMRVSGSFFELMVFFDEISNLKRIVNINQFVFTSPTLRNQKIVMNSNFELLTYRYLAPAKPKRPPQRR